MRYIWDHFHLYRAGAGRLTRLAMPMLAHKLRIWDVTTAMRVDHFVANSRFVAQRILSYYRRDADVIPPPVAVEAFHLAPAEEVGTHYLMAGELVHYKRPDLYSQPLYTSPMRPRVSQAASQQRPMRPPA